MDTTLEFTTTATVDERNHAIDEIWADLRESGELQRRAAASDVDTTELLRASRGSVLAIASRGSRLDPATTAILLTFATTIGAKAAAGLATMSGDLWREIILPRLRKKFGPDGVRPKAE